MASKRNPDNSLRLSVAQANLKNAARRVRPFMTDDELVDYLDSLPKTASKTMPYELAVSRDTVAQREWCESHKIASVAVYDDGFCERRAGRPKTKDGWRPDNAMLIRLKSLESINPARFARIRVESNPVQLATVLSLKWTAGKMPESFAGADRIYIVRVGEPPKKKK